MSGNHSTRKTIEILSLIAETQGGITLNEIATKLNYPKSSVCDILTTLKEMKMVVYQDQRIKNYIIGSKLYVIGNSYIQNEHLIHSSKDIIRKLGNQLNRSIFLGQENNGKVIHLYKYEPERTIVSTPNIGTQAGLYHSALGKAMLAFRKDKIELMKQIHYEKFTEKTLMNHFDLTRDLQQIEKLGYSIESGESIEHILSVGAPIFNQKHEVIAAISASGLLQDGVDIKYIATCVKMAALDISKTMGYKTSVYEEINNE